MIKKFDIRDLVEIPDDSFWRAHVKDDELFVLIDEDEDWEKIKK